MSKSIFRQKLTRNFTTIPNDILKNPELSWKAKGIHAYLLSLPETWIVRLNHLKSISTDGYDSTVAGVNELLDKKYLWRRPCCGENPGGWEYYVYQYPQLEDPFRSGDSPTREIPDSGKPATNKDRLSKVNKEYKENLLTSLKEELESSAVASHSSEVVTQSNLFSTYPNEGHTSGSATAELKSADGRGTTPPMPLAPPRTKKPRATKLADDAFIALLRKANPRVDFDTELRKMDNWLLANKGREKSRAFVSNWINRVVDKLPPEEDWKPTTL